MSTHEMTFRDGHPLFGYRGMVIVLLALAISSCGMNQRERQALGCYDIRQESGPSVWPVLEFTSDEMNFEGHSWRRITTRDPVHKLSIHSLWRIEGDTLHLIFAPDDHNVSDNYGSWASLQPTEHGYVGKMTTETLYASESTLELTRRPCGDNP